MVIERKPKYYTCLDPIALADLFILLVLLVVKALILVIEALLFTTNCTLSKSDHRSSTHKQSETTYTKQTRQQLEQYTNHIKTVQKVYKMILCIATITQM